MSLNKLFDFVEFTLKFQKVKRIVLSYKEDTWENDTEHSYQLAMVAWYINNTNSLNYDLEKIIKMALAHDLVEIYAGDTYIYAEASELNSKKEREEKALLQIEEEFKEFPDLINLIKEYEERKSKESKFIYALDKLLPIINIYLDGGRTWKQVKVTLDQLIENKSDKIAFSKEVNSYYIELITVLKENREKLFYTGNQLTEP